MCIVYYPIDYCITYGWVTYYLCPFIHWQLTYNDGWFLLYRSSRIWSMASASSLFIVCKPKSSNTSNGYFSNLASSFKYVPSTLDSNICSVNLFMLKYMAFNPFGTCFIGQCTCQITLATLILPLINIFIPILMYIQSARLVRVSLDRFLLGLHVTSSNVDLYLNLLNFRYNSWRLFFLL